MGFCVDRTTVFRCVLKRVDFSSLYDVMAVSIAYCCVLCCSPHSSKNIGRDVLQFCLSGRVKFENSSLVSLILLEALS